MFKGKSLKQLIEISKQTTKKLNVELEILDKTLDETIKQVPDEQKSEVEKIKGNAQRVFALMKKGKIKEANELIKTMQDGSKSNR